MSVLIQIQGGIGNQLFQYATGLSVAKYYETNLIINRTWFNNIPEGSTPRELLLEKLNIHDTHVIYQNTPSQHNRIKQLVFNFIGIGPLNFHEKSSFSYDEDIFNLHLNKKSDLHLFGYWQSFKYFLNDRNMLKNQLFFWHKKLSDIEKKYWELILSPFSVSVHIRRGDYVHSKSAAKIHGALSLEFYDNAIKKIINLIPNAHFFIFSDDINWCKSNLKGPYFTFIENGANNQSELSDLFLMSECRHQIISNSSFSWWAAWLNHNPKKIVIAPDQWLKEKKVGLDDLIPQDWLKMPAYFQI